MLQKNDVRLFSKHLPPSKMHGTGSDNHHRINLIFYCVITYRNTFCVGHLLMAVQYKDLRMLYTIYAAGNDHKHKGHVSSNE